MHPSDYRGAPCSRCSHTFNFTNAVPSGVVPLKPLAPFNMKKLAVRSRALLPSRLGFLCASVVPATGGIKNRCSGDFPSSHR